MAQQLQHRQRKTRGFASTRLGGGHHVVAGQYGGNTLPLDWGGLGVALFGNSLENWLPQA